MGPLEQMGRSALAFLPDLIFLVILFVVTRWLLRLVKLFFQAIERGNLKLQTFEPEWAIPTYRLIRVGIIAFAAVVAYPYIPGAESAAFKGVTLFLGILISIGSSSAISNIVAGYMLTYRRAFRVGDRVRIDDVIGDVTAVRMQVTHVRNPKNELVSIPNSTILNSQVINYSTLAAADGLILHLTVGIGYETPWRQVEAMLLEAAGRTAGLKREPSPFVQQLQLGDFAVTYELNAFCDAPHQMASLRTAMHRSVLDVFNAYGVQIMTPAYEGDPEQPKLVPREQWYTAPAVSPGPGRSGA
jgi:small-conductance mechanosensitive channel